MNEFLFEKADFKKVMKKHCYEVLQLLISKSEHFQIVCDTRFVSYEPKLPDSYIDSSLSYIMFYISDYSVESVNLNDKLMSFYAGFGPDNFTGLYIDMLSSGGSKSPAELITKFGFNVDDEKFWKIGILEIQNLVDEFLRFKI